MRQINSITLFAGLLLTSNAYACQNTGDFNQWLNSFKQQSIQSGLRADVVNSALSNVRLDQSVIKRDRSQAVFAQDFLTFAGKKVSNYRLQHGKKHIKSNAKLFQRIERQFGVPPTVLTAFWALETDFGAVTGNFPTLNALATLAYDCRRPQRFRSELTHALQLIQKGDQTPATMKGAWAGELGQLQFLPSGYNQHAVDYDGDGKRDLIRSRADALASAASLLKAYGWRAGQPWLVEVKVPQQMNWAQARLNNKIPVAQWSSQGITLPNGRPLPNNGAAALILPMGRNGPAFLAYHNFDVFLKWNESTVYSTTAAYLATRFTGAPAMRRGNAPIRPLSMAQVKQVQTKLQQRGLNVGKIDGIIGEKTRAATRQVQQQLKLPADGYPDGNLLKRL